MEDEICDHLCNNTLGGFECQCQPGFILGDNKRTCFGKCILYTYVTSYIYILLFISKQLKLQCYVYTIFMDL